MSINTHDASAGVVSFGRSDLKVVSFKLGDCDYGVDVSEVMGIYRGLPVIPTPDMPAHVDGEICLQDQRIPVISMRRFVGMDEPATIPISRWIMVLRHNHGPVGLAVDCVTEVVRLRADSLRPF